LSRCATVSMGTVAETIVHILEQDGWPRRRQHAARE
jgi:hypothetical protein